MKFISVEDLIKFIDSERKKHEGSNTDVSLGRDMILNDLEHLIKKDEDDIIYGNE